MRLCDNRINSDCTEHRIANIARSFFSNSLSPSSAEITETKLSMLFASNKCILFCSSLIPEIISIFIFINKEFCHFSALP